MTVPSQWPLQGLGTVCLRQSGPAYINDMLQPVTTLQRNVTLRSDTNNDLVVPRARLRFGERAFSVAAPRLWNSLPVDIRNAATLDTLKKKLKTFMFYKHLLE